MFFINANQGEELVIALILKEWKHKLWETQAKSFLVHLTLKLSPYLRSVQCKHFQAHIKHTLSLVKDHSFRGTWNNKLCHFTCCLTESNHFALLLVIWNYADCLIFPTNPRLSVVLKATSGDTSQMCRHETR